MMLMFSFIILTGIKALLLLSFCNSLNIFFLSINLKENDRFFYPSFPILSSNVLIISFLQCNSSFKTLSWWAQVSFAPLIKNSEFSRSGFNFCAMIGSISFRISLTI